jgi:hypothetical protein
MPDLAQAIKELQETAIVMSGIQARQAELIKDHSDWLHSHDLAVARHDKEIAEARKLGRETDDRIAQLVSAIGELLRKQS